MCQCCASSMECKHWQQDQYGRKVVQLYRMLQRFISRDTFASHRRLLPTYDCLQLQICLKHRPLVSSYVGKVMDQHGMDFVTRQVKKPNLSYTYITLIT